MKKILLFLFLTSITTTFSQKKVIDHTVYNDWKKIESQIISKDGNFVSYITKPHRGDGYVYIYNIKKAKLDSIPRGYKHQFSGNSNFLVFKISAGFDTLRSCELKKIDKEKWPKDSLGIYLLESDSLIKIPSVKNFSLPDEGDWITYTVESNSLKLNPTKEKKKLFGGKKKKPSEEEYKSDGKLFTAYNPITHKKHQHKDVTDFIVSNKGQYVALTLHKKEKKINTYQLAIFDINSGNFNIESTKKSSINSFVFNHSESSLAFLSTSDTAKNKQYELVLYDIPNKKWNVLADTTTTSIPLKKGVSEHRAPVFSENDTDLFFGVSNRPKKEVKDTLLESEKAKLDLWHYEDKRLQPQQLVELKNDQKKNDLYVIHLADKKFVQLSNDTLRIHLPEKPKGNYLFATSRELYQGTYNWTSPNLEDHYRVTIADGKIEPLKKAVGFGGELSPSGNWYTYFKGEEGDYYLMNVTSKQETCMTCSRKDVRWEIDVNGMPELAGPHGIIGWLKGEDQIMIQSEYDISNYFISQKKLTSYTNEEGKDAKVRLSIHNWERDSSYLDPKNCVIQGFDENTKGKALYDLENHEGHTDLVKRYYVDNAIITFERSENGKMILFRKGSVKDYPELFIMSNNFDNEKRISVTNPQQSQYNWSTVELVKWTSYDGIPLEGLVYKPENFDPNKSYPMLVYYYELHSDDLHSHYAPKPTASVIHPTEYASAGYIVFMPDIRYKEGHPAKSAYDCIMSGTDHVLKLYPNIDSKKLGLQGQSWGGYQTAQLITMTKRYAAAMAGAPVSNMFSAYGGIRWGTGLNRQFQYEKQQSRIGKTIWEAPELYIENSPLFQVPKISTPLLIMSNDQDGAVPWYQGIELFTAMKRLGKPCWLLNYNGDDHNLMKNSNRFDLSIRMRQFFDYYLLGTPAPKWLMDGIPATVKGEEYRLEIKDK